VKKLRRCAYSCVNVHVVSSLFQSHLGRCSEHAKAPSGRRARTAGVRTLGILSEWHARAVCVSVCEYALTANEGRQQTLRRRTPPLQPLNGSLEGICRSAALVICGQSRCFTFAPAPVPRAPLISQSSAVWLATIVGTSGSEMFCLGGHAGPGERSYLQSHVVVHAVTHCALLHGPGKTRHRGEEGHGAFTVRQAVLIVAAVPEAHTEDRHAVLQVLEPASGSLSLGRNVRFRTFY
jgi:hypothetical protein